MFSPTRDPDPGRRGALKKIALGAGAVTTLPIFGQAASPPRQPGMVGMSHHEHGGEHAAPINDPHWKPVFFDEHQNETVIALTELIIPQTDTPGAKAALVNRFIDLWLNDEESDKQKSAIEGLAWMDGRSMMLHAKPFVQLSPDEQTALLTPLADRNNKSPDDEPGVRFFEELKDFTIFGYYSSQPGLDEELQYAGDDYHAEFPGACTHPDHQS